MLLNEIHFARIVEEESLLRKELEISENVLSEHFQNFTHVVSSLISLNQQQFSGPKESTTSRETQTEPAIGQNTQTCNLIDQKKNVTTHIPQAREPTIMDITMNERVQLKQQSTSNIALQPQLTTADLVRSNPTLLDLMLLDFDIRSSNKLKRK